MYKSKFILPKGCEYNGQCLKRNETVSEQCKIQRCDERNNLVGIYTVETGCPFFNGRCLNTGEFAVDKCRLYHCQAELVNGEVWFTAKEKAVMCEDVHGECHGAGMKMTLRSKYGQNINCTCIVNGLTVGYQC
ncbi:hypothetical protein LOTGIDRAFT_230692 [Lottia gigantea]|uniref:Uncharacterized protein n=1 Tax=Lottia gigantea TaxID=225164 RepID=V4B1Y4_LOTGI|nr:hypothetical protein LOTGIDRAFT_230692 [Lottia gigantea]ESP01416.1 hypothetical protein LOTGIDRAFT_230692 [Lottia gigantea]